MDLIQILFQVLRFLLELEVIARNAILQLFVCILHLVKLHLQFEYFFDSVEEVLMKLLLLSLILDLELVTLLFDHPFLHDDHIRLLLF